MGQSNIENSKGSELNSYLLKLRLKRVPQVDLERFLNEFKDTTDISKTKENLAKEIISYYEIMNNNSDFMSKFRDFVRDYVISAGESEYLIEVDNKEDFIRWINQWSDNKFIGKRFFFYKSFDFSLNEKFLILEEENGVTISNTKDFWDKSIHDSSILSFPSQVFFLVAYTKETKTFFSKDKLIEYNDTYEFEIVLRKDSPLVGVRGSYSVVRDFFSSAVVDSTSPCSKAHSLFVGNFDKQKTRPLAKPRKCVNIEKLKEALNGEYLDIDAPVSGDQATRMKVSLKGMRNVNEETNPILGPAVKEVWQGQEKSRIGFRYNGKEHIFSVTKNGGLYFRKFAPEEVVTYVLLKISSL